MNTRYCMKAEQARKKDKVANTRYCMKAEQASELVLHESRTSKRIGIALEYSAIRCKGANTKIGIEPELGSIR